MPKLTAKQRTNLPKSDFAVKSKAKTSKGRKAGGSFPMPDKAHAIAGLALIKNAPPSERPAIKAKANRILKKGRSK